MNNNKKVAFKRLAANYVGRDYIVADVHGYFDLLQQLLDESPFNPATDRLFIAGDLVDRGPESAKLLEWLAKPWVHAVMGNHDYWHLHHEVDEFRELSERHGGLWRTQLSEGDLQAVLKAIARLPVAIELSGRNGQRWGIVHAECGTGSWNDLVDSLTGRFHLAESELEEFKQICMHQVSKIMTSDTGVIADIDELFVGHYSVAEVASLGNVIYLDTGVYRNDGALTLVDMHSKERWRHAAA